MEDKALPKWLRELQQRSWEPEILLSGIVLYGMLQLPDLLTQFLFYFKSNIFGSFTDVDNLISILKVGVYWITAGLIIHLFSRGIWIGFVGLSYTFPKGVRTEKLHYKGRFLKKVETIPSLIHIVDRLERVCSTIFSFSFLLFMIVLGGYSFIFLLMALPYMIIIVLLNFDFNHPLIFYYRYFYTLPISIIGLISFIDFLTLGALKRVKWLEPFYWPAHRFVSFATLSGTYRNIYYVLVSNMNKWGVAVTLILLTVLSIVFAIIDVSTQKPGQSISRVDLWSHTTRNSVYNGYYDSMNEGTPSIYASIPSDVISGDVLKLFIVADIRIEHSILKYLPYDSISRENPDLDEQEVRLEIIKRFYSIYIDDELVEEYQPFFHFKRHTNQKGYLSYQDISKLEKGMHKIKIVPVSSKNGRAWATIPFYKS